MPDRPKAENFPEKDPASETTVPQRPNNGSRSPEEIEAVIAEINRLLCLDNGEPCPPPPRAPHQPEPNEDGLIVVDGPDAIPPWLRSDVDLHNAYKPTTLAEITENWRRR